MCRKSGDNPFLRARKRLILGRDDSSGWNINRIPEPFTGEVVLPEQADVGRWDDGVVGNGSPDLRFDLIGGGLVDARSDARDPIEPRKLIFKIRREIIIKMTAPAPGLLNFAYDNVRCRAQSEHRVADPFLNIDG